MRQWEIRYNDLDLTNVGVQKVIEDSSGQLWVAFIGSVGGLCRFDKKREKVDYYHSKTNLRGLCMDAVWDIFEDKSGVLWLAVAAGLNRYNRETDTFECYCDKQQYGGLRPDRDVCYLSAFCIYEDRAQRLWIGGYDGLKLFDREDKTFRFWNNLPKNPGSMKRNAVHYIFEDSKERLWLGIQNGGLNLFNLEENTFKHYTKAQGLASDIVYAIMEDPDGNLWLSTNKGLSKFNPESNTFLNFDVRDGLQDNDFSKEHALNVKTGRCCLVEQKDLMPFSRIL